LSSRENYNDICLYSEDSCHHLLWWFKADHKRLEVSKSQRQEKPIAIKTNENFLVAAVVTLLLVHLHTLDDHLTVLLPGGVPLVASIPELLSGEATAISPRLARSTVLEPTIGTTDSDVENEVEVLVEGSVVLASSSPRVHESGTVTVANGESTLLPERLVEVDVHDLEKTRVDVGENILLGPLEAESVETLGVCGVESSVLVVVEPPTIVGRVGTPVESAAHDIVAALSVGVVVSAGLHDINFTRTRPGTVYIVLGQHPDGGPQPVTLRELGLDLDATELDGCTTLGANASGLDGVDNGTVGGVGAGNTVGPDIRRAGAVCEQVDDVVLLNELCVLKSGLQVEHAILNE